MKIEAGKTLKRRRLPAQSRAQVTVESIFEATIQVLISDGPARINTTKIADRTGVSVGTLYQYFPNKQSLLLALLERHFNALASALERVCEANLNACSARIAEVVVSGYLDAQLLQAEVAPSLYFIAIGFDAGELIDSAAQRGAASIQRLLETASDAKFNDCTIIARSMTAVLFGAVPALCVRVLSESSADEAKKQLTIMFRAYLNECSE